MVSNVEKIKERLDIADVVGAYLKLEKSGVNYKARCPFHNEKTASFFVSPGRQSFYCFGCQAGGDIFTFVERLEGLDFKGALKTLADKAGVALVAERPEEAKAENRIFDLLETSAKFFENNLAGQKQASGYLEKRGVSKNSVALWRIGLAKAEWRSAFEFLKAKGFSENEMLRAGMIKRAAATGNVVSKYYDTFRDRIMFPIFDSAGRVIAFSGRALKEDEKSPKYLNSPETELFKKSETLYGFNFAKNFLRKLDYAILVEGQLDIILAHQAGSQNAVASSGTALTEKHLEKISKITKRIVIAYDSDQAGKSAAKRAGQMALGLGMEVKVVSLPEGEDPASVISKSAERWKEALKSSADLVTFAATEAVGRSAGSETRLAKEVREGVLPYISEIRSDILKSQYIGILSKISKIPEKSLWADLGQMELRKKDETAEGQERVSHFSEEEMVAGIILWQEGLPNPAIDTAEMRQKLADLSGASAEEISEGKNEEALIFEAENRFGSIDVAKAASEIIQRLEKVHLSDRLQKTAALLDSSPEGDKGSIKDEILKISKKITNLFN